MEVSGDDKNFSEGNGFTNEGCESVSGLGYNYCNGTEAESLESKNYVGEMASSESENKNNSQDLWSKLTKLDCPFVWKPDKDVESHPRGEVLPDMADNLEEKEKEFVRAETNTFREIVIYLVVSYQRHLSKQETEALQNLYHCYKLLLDAENSISQMMRGNGSNQNGDSDVLVQETSDLMLTTDKQMVSPGNTQETPSAMKDSSHANKFGMLNISSQSESNNNHGKQEQMLKNMITEDDIFSKLLSSEDICQWTSNTNAEEDCFESYNMCDRDMDGESISFENESVEHSKQDSKKKLFFNQDTTQEELIKGLERVNAVQFVISSSLAHIAYNMGYETETLQVIEFMEERYSECGIIGKATISALRASVLCEYGYVGNTLGLPWIKEALTLDPEYWEWNLICAKVIGRLRRNELSCSSAPTDEEVELLEKAVKLNPKNASCLVHLANTYRTLASIEHHRIIASQELSVSDDPHLSSRLQGNWRRNRSSWRQEERWRPMPSNNETSKKYLAAAKELYLEALQLEKNCPYNNARCAKGLWSMPPPYKQKEIAQEAILRALCLAPDDSLVNHYAGIFYEYCRDSTKALTCYEKATRIGKYNYPAEINYINLCLKISPPGSYSPVFRLDRLLHKYNTPNQMIQTLCIRGYYHYKVDKVLLQAIRNFSTAIQIQPTSQTLIHFYPGQILKNYPEPVNIYDLLEKILQEFERHTDYTENQEFTEKARNILQEGRRILEQQQQEEVAK